MSFLNPAAFVFLLGVPAVILLHLLKIRRRQALVSSTLLWTDSLRDQQASAPFRRLKPTWLLLLQILAILLLALALARPVRTVLVPGYERTVLILDVSASMQATDVAGSRFAAAQAAGPLIASAQAAVDPKGAVQYMREVADDLMQAQRVGTVSSFQKAIVSHADVEVSNSRPSTEMGML